MLNSDGEIEEDQETHAERHARIVALAEVFTLLTILRFFPKLYRGVCGQLNEWV